MSTNNIDNIKCLYKLNDTSEIEFFSIGNSTMTISKTAEAVRLIQAARASGKPLSVQVVAREFEISAAAIYAQLKREEGRQRCPCCGQVVKEGYEVNKAVLKDG